MKKNVLVAGIGQTNYIFQLYSVIAPKHREFNFNTINLADFGNTQTTLQAEKIFQKNYVQNTNFRNPFTLLKAIIPLLFSSYFWKDQLVSLAENRWKYFSTGFYLTLRHINAFSYARYIDTKTETDIIHLHFPKHIFALFLKYLKKDYQLIITYWGSDIYRIDSWLDHSIQDSILQHSRIITTATPEMEFAILTRFGFDLKPKIRKARFIHDVAYYEYAEKWISEEGWQDSFKKSWNIEKNKIVILFGHNAHKENNHLEFLQVLKKLPKEILSNFHIVFPLSYGDKGGYINKLKSFSEEIPASFTFITDFLEWEEMAKLKIISDVYIHGPTTDGLSAFLTEFFYTDNLAIVGGWLPYNTFGNFGIKYLKFNDFSELEHILLKLADNLADRFKGMKGNRDKVKKYFNVDFIAQEWSEIFRELKS